VVESVEQTKAALRFKAPKTEQARAVTLPAFAVEELRRLKRRLVEGIHPMIVQERLGHSSIAITLDLYSHVIGTLQEMPRPGSTWRSALL
jgi:hypothetical protein